MTKVIFFSLLLQSLTWGLKLEFYPEKSLSHSKLTLNDLLKESSEPLAAHILNQQIVLLGRPGSSKNVSTRAICSSSLRTLLSKVQKENLECLPNKIILHHKGTALEIESIHKKIDEKISSMKQVGDSLEVVYPNLHRKIFLPNVEGRFTLDWSDHFSLKGVQSIVLKVWSKNKMIDRRVLSLKIKRFGKVPVLLKAIRRKQKVTAEDVRWEWRDVTRRMGASPTNSELEGTVARRTLSLGRKLVWSDLIMPTTVRKGQNLTLQSHKFPGLVVTGLALEDGQVGQWISVKNLNSGVKISGNVDKEGAVWVD